MQIPLSIQTHARRMAGAIFLPLGLLLAVGTPSDAQLRLTPGLSTVRFLEVTGATTPHPFAASALQMTTRLANPLGPSNADFVGLSNEYYDVFYSNEAGVFDPDGDYVTIECQFPASGGLNIDEVYLDFDDGSEVCACGVTNAVYLGSGQIAGSAAKAAGCTPGTWSTMGSTSGTEERLGLTLDFCQSICHVAPGQCCAGRPAFEDPLYTFTGQVAVGTASRMGTDEPVLTVYDFGPSTFPAAVGTNLAPIGRYSDPRWTGAELGSIFGVTFDGAGDIFTTATTCYSVDLVAGGGSGAVYKVDRVTGNVTTFATLPNSGPGLGNLAYDCENDQFFVTNHENGWIHRLSSTGALLSAFDFGAPDDGSDGFAPLGERVWGVTVHEGRVWFGVWKEDFGRQDMIEDNEVWSVALDANGEFVGVERHEATILPTAAPIYTNPISDLRFSPTGSMLLAQRGMETDTWPRPHDADALEYVCVDGEWVPSTNKFLLGVSGRNCSGGLDFDYGPGNRGWWSADQMNVSGDQIYGFQGVPATGGMMANSYLLDYDGAITSWADKTQIGDIAISCTPCGLVYDVKTACTGIGSKVKLTFTFENIEPYSLLLLSLQDLPSGVTANPAGFLLGGLAPYDSVTLTTTLSGVTAGQTLCFDLSTADPLHAGCEFEVCITLPSCPPWIDVTDLAFGGPGFTDFDVIGDPVGTGGNVDFYVSLAPPNTNAWIVAGFLNFPFPVLGGTLVPIDAVAVVPGVTNAEGEFTLGLNIAGTLPVTLYAQALVLDPSLPQLVGFSNALQIQIY
jgi:hypothetical protein